MLARSTCKTTWLPATSAAVRIDGVATIGVTLVEMPESSAQTSCATSEVPPAKVVDTSMTMSSSSPWPMSRAVLPVPTPARSSTLVEVMVPLVSAWPVTVLPTMEPEN